MSNFHDKTHVRKPLGALRQAELPKTPRSCIAPNTAKVSIIWFVMLYATGTKDLQGRKPVQGKCAVFCHDENPGNVRVKKRREEEKS